MKTVFQSIRTLIVLSLITGGIYPLAVWGIGQLLFHNAVEGSLIRHDNKIVGSVLLTQKFTQPQYFWPRPSAADYATIPSGASNAAWTSHALRTRINDTTIALRKANGLGDDAKVPAELVTTSGSGLDPYLSLEAVLFQFDRVARARHLNDDQQRQLRALIEQSQENEIFSSPCINILRLNLALDISFKTSD